MQAVLKQLTSVPTRVHPWLRILLLAASVVGTGICGGASDPLERGFADPPAAARPCTLWMWMNGNVTADGITRDLEAMHRVGLGGALIFNVGEFIPKGPVEYGKASWLELMQHAAREADRLGLELAMHNCPGWSSSGGPWITPELSMQQLVWTETKINGPQSGPVHLAQPFTRLDYYRDVAVLAFPSLPGEERSFAESLAGITNGQGSAVDEKLLTDGDLSTSVPAGPDNPLVLAFAEPFEARAVTVFYTSGGGTIGFTLEAGDDGVTFRPVTRLTPASPRAIEDASLVATFEPVRARFFRLTPLRRRGVCEVRLHRAPRIPGWNYKANFAYRAARDEGPPADVPTEFTIDPGKVIDLTKLMDARGDVRWTAPAGAWTILRIGQTARGQQNIAAPDAGVGLECDKMSRAATRFHFQHGLGALLKKLGPLVGKSFTGLEVDSYEVGMQNWTAGFEKEFKTRNGYDLTRYLPAMIGYYVGSAAISERFLWDVRRTQAQLVADYYYGELQALCRKRGLRLYVEPYGAGPGPYDELEIGGRADVPMGEFWAHFPWDDIPSVKLAASAAHVYGKRVVAGESFTATEEQSRFLDYPNGLKTTGDLAFSFGLNRMFFHRYAHQPHPTAVPGMTMGPWGFNFDRNNTWFEQSGPWLEYLTRCQFLLQRGTPAADVLYFTGEGSPRASKRLRPDLPAGYDFDAVDAEALSKARVVRGRIVLPGGSGYRLLVLQDELQSITPALMKNVRDLVMRGATVSGSKPAFSPTLQGYPATDAELRRMADELWGNESRGATTGEHQAGKGLIVFGRTLPEILTTLGIKPDFEYRGARPDTALVWQHRRVDDADVYFVANRRRRSEDVVCTFRVDGKVPELWQPETGGTSVAALYDFEDGRTRVPLHFEPGESVFVVFRAAARVKPVRWLAKDGSRIDDASSVSPAARNDATVENNFTVAAWIKPDTDMTAMPQENATNRLDENGKSWVLPAPDGSSNEAGHAAMGIAAGRNGVFVAERAGDWASAVLVSRTPLSGWTHLAVVYRDGRPRLYLNGKFEREGFKSGRTVHPAVAEPPPTGRLVYYFDGDMTAPELFPEALSDERIAGLAAGGLPPPDGLPPIELHPDAAGLRATVWEPGRYSLSDGRSANVGALPPGVAIAGPWQVSFPENSGAPRGIVLTNLVSFRLHPDAGVRYFSGTAIYRNTFPLSGEAVSGGNRVWLDLGRVAVMADVRVNGRLAGALWKPPFRIDITKVAHPGANDLEVRVTTLLVNRLIGDEHLPAENDYDPRTHAITRLPDWYREGKPKPAGGRLTFATWKFYGPEDPLVESGLLGPVRLFHSVETRFEK